MASLTHLERGAEPRRKAVALISGGLDSMLAAKLMLEQGIHVEGLNFFTGFCVEGHTHAIRKTDRVKRNNALWCAEQLGIKLHFVDVVDEYKNVLLNPKHGYGTHLNPCLDCKVFMVSKAKQWLEREGFDFIVTGEVVGQRPMSQVKAKMNIVAAEAATEDRLLRPLSAHHFPPTLPERAGWVDRDKLLGLNGRGRRPQIEMAARFGFSEFAQPAGGCCFLTDANYSRKLADLWAARGSRDYELDDVMLLKVGRHLRPRPHFKLIVARESGETHFLQGYTKQFPHLFTISHSGPLALIDGDLAGAADAELAARIVARFSQGREADQVDVRLVRNGEESVLSVAPLSESEILPDWYV